MLAEMHFFTERFGKQHGTQVLIDAPITHQDIADSINMNRETASRALKDLSSEGLIGQQDYFFTILDLEKLKEVLV